MKSPKRKKAKAEMNGIISNKMTIMGQWVTKKVEIYLKRRKRKTRIMDSSMKEERMMISMMMMISNLTRVKINNQRQHHLGHLKNKDILALLLL